jgi:hypothetical protein
MISRCPHVLGTMKTTPHTIKRRKGCGGEENDDEPDSEGSHSPTITTATIALATERSDVEDTTRTPRFCWPVSTADDMMNDDTSRQDRETLLIVDDSVMVPLLARARISLRRYLMRRCADSKNAVSIARQVRIQRRHRS